MSQVTFSNLGKIYCYCLLWHSVIVSLLPRPTTVTITEKHCTKRRKRIWTQIISYRVNRLSRARCWPEVVKSPKLSNVWGFCQQGQKISCTKTQILPNLGLGADPAGKRRRKPLVPAQVLMLLDCRWRKVDRRAAAGLLAGLLCSSLADRSRNRQKLALYRLSCLRLQEDRPRYRVPIQFYSTLYNLLASVIMQRLSYPTETALSNKITRNRIVVLSF